MSQIPAPIDATKNALNGLRSRRITTSFKIKELASKNGLPLIQIV